MDEIQDSLNEIVERLANLERTLERRSWELAWQLDCMWRLQRIREDLGELRGNIARVTFAEGDGVGRNEEEVRSQVIQRLRFIQSEQLDRFRIPYSGFDETGEYIEGLSELLSMDLEEIERIMPEFPSSLGEIENAAHRIGEQLDNLEARKKEMIQIKRSQH
jgi:DNA repair exonuclease SbcCD ATPase subunit